jgi:lipid-A-disaccharide synthase
MPKIAMVAGEASGDLLGAHLIAALKKQRKDLQFFGIAGPKMQSEGANSLYPIEKLSVRGYVEVLNHLFSLLKLRRNLLRQILNEKPDVFIGIDAPDFNFWLERKLKKHGIPTIHYASPSIWAWRGGRIHKIKRAVSHMLTLFPFEPAIYQKAGVPVTFVGHPLADEIPLKPNMKGARETLKLKQSSLVIAMLPGSRQSEVQQHADLFIKTAQLIAQENSNSIFLVPLITRATRNLFERMRSIKSSQSHLICKCFLVTRTMPWKLQML